jgi:hypothetical protein
MTSTEYTTEPTVAEQAAEQDEQAEVERLAEVSPLEDADGIGPALLVTLIGGMALVLAVLTPVAGVKAGGLLIVVVTAVIGFRLLRRGGSSR